MTRVRVRVDVGELALGHSIKGIHAHYDDPGEYQPMIDAAVQAVANEVERILIPPGDNVVPLGVRSVSKCQSPFPRQPPLPALRPHAERIRGFDLSTRHRTVGELLAQQRSCSQFYPRRRSAYRTIADMPAPTRNGPEVRCSFQFCVHRLYTQSRIAFR